MFRLKSNRYAGKIRLVFFLLLMVKLSAQTNPKKDAELETAASLLEPTNPTKEPAPQINYLNSPTTEQIDTSNLETLDSEEIESLGGNTVADAFLNVGYQYLQKKDFPKAKKYFSRAKEEGQGEASRRAHLALIHLQASLGEENVFNEIDELRPADKPEGYFLISDGWESYFLDNPSQEKYLELAKEYYSFLAARYRSSKWVQKSRIKLANLYIKQKEYDFALDNILTILEREKGNKSASSLQNEIAWYLLGQILEHSDQHKDYQRAVIAYGRVLKNPKNPFYKTAKERIQYIKQFFLLNP